MSGQRLGDFNLNRHTETGSDFDEYDEVSDDISQLRFEDIPALALFAFLISVVGLQFFTRYVLNDSISWTEEIARYTLVVLTFLGSAICVRQGNHLLIEVIYRYIPARAVKPLALLNEILTMTFFGGLAWLGVALVERTSRQMMITLPFPKSYVYGAITAGCVLAVIYGLVNIMRILRAQPEDVLRKTEGGI